MSSAAVPAAFRERLAAALAVPEGSALGALLHAPTVTAVVADPREEEWLHAGLPTLLAVLDRAGVPRARALVLLAATIDTDRARAAARALREVLGVPVIAHDPDRSACYGAGRTSAGTLVELNDELREAEAIVLFAAARPGAGDDPGAEGLVFPGLASRASALAVARETRAFDGGASDACVRSARACAPLDLVVLWRPGPDADAWAGPSERSADAIARMASTS